MPEPISSHVERLARPYVDGTRFTSSDDVLIFAMSLLGEFDQRYHDQLGKRLEQAFAAIDNGEGLGLDGVNEVEGYFADMMEANRKRSQNG